MKEIHKQGPIFNFQSHKEFKAKDTCYANHNYGCIESLKVKHFMIWLVLELRQQIDSKRTNCVIVTRNGAYNFIWMTWTRSKGNGSGSKHKVFNWEMEYILLYDINYHSLYFWWFLEIRHHNEIYNTFGGVHYGK